MTGRNRQPVPGRRLTQMAGRASAGRSTNVAQVLDGHDTSEQATPHQFVVVVVTGRPTVRAFFAEIGRVHESSVAVELLPLDARAVGAAADRLAAPSVAVVDASVERTEAIAVCAAIRERRAEL